MLITLLILGLVLFIIGLLYFLLQPFYPNKKILGIFCLTLAAASSFWLLNVPQHYNTAKAGLTPQEKQLRQQEQQSFSSWYEEYKKKLEQLDQNWQQYHHIQADFKADNISIQTVYVRLTHLASRSAQLNEDIKALTPPANLSPGNSDLVKTIITKTIAYSNAQYMTIEHSRAAADPAQLLSKRQEEQSRRLQEIMIRESPPTLFTAVEISKLKDNLTIPDED